MLLNYTGFFISTLLLFLLAGTIIWMPASGSLSMAFDLGGVMTIFLFTLFLVTSGVLAFSTFYFKEAKDSPRFYPLFFLFVLSMVILIIHRDFTTLFLGWDGLGISSYLLVAFYNNSKSINGAMVTVMTNRAGDVSLLLLLAQFWGSSGGETPMYSLGLFFLLVLAAFTKSAQYPFSSWLPLAMSAPTPVSSLVHSSTLVTAGVFLVIKYFPWMGNTVIVMALLLGFITCFIAGCLALSEKDAKKIVALSTLSQLGFMFISLGLSCPGLAFFHLLTHAFFKSCMFIQVGTLIISSSSMQDGRGYSSPSSFIGGVVLGGCALSLCGFSFSSGFVSKDAILSASFEGGPLIFSSVILYICICLTFLYSARLVSFSSNTNSSVPYVLNPSHHLTLASVFLGFMGWAGGWLLSSVGISGPLFFLGMEKIFILFLWLTPLILCMWNLEPMTGISGMFYMNKMAVAPSQFLNSWKIVDGWLSGFSKIMPGLIPFLGSSSFFIWGGSIFLLLLIMLFLCGVWHAFLPKKSY